MADPSFDHIDFGEGYEPDPLASAGLRRVLACAMRVVYAGDLAGVRAHWKQELDREATKLIESAA